MVRRSGLLAWFAAALAVSAGAQAWWDTQVRAQKPVPLVKAWNAAALAGAGDVRPDAQADGGKGGKAAYVKPGTALTASIDLKRSMYVVWMIARADEKEFTPPANANQELEVNGTKLSLKYPRQPAIATLSVKQPDGQVRRWAMPITYRTDYAVVCRLYFPLHIDGPCQISVGLDATSKTGLLVDRVEVRDVFGNCARVPAKTSRMLMTDEELAELRKSFREEEAKKPERSRAKPVPPRSAEQRRQRADELWASLPELNILTADPGWKRWLEVIGRSSGRGPQIPRLANGYAQSGDAELAWDAAVLLCAFAEKWPGIDHYVSADQIANGSYPLTWSTAEGKITYSGWEPGTLAAMARAYDGLFDFIQGNAALAECVGTKIPWVKTPKDVIELLDTAILQHGMDCLNRRVLRSDEVSALVPLVQGVNAVSKRMLEEGLFARVHFNMADTGGLDDQAFTSFNRGGVHYVGSTLYVGPALTDIAGYLQRYCAAGGDAKFNLSDPKRYPNMAEAQKTKDGLHAAGGFPIIVGDAMDLRRTRVKGLPEFSSRVLEGFGQVVLEDGQGQAEARARRAVAIHTGIGRGHAHQDTLNLEMFAHGTRLAPDLGGRHEGKNRSSPNMLRNRMHNVVGVDDRDFCNPFPGSTTSATGWTTAFSPQPGAQYTANSARATSHPQVRLYQRSTAMIDGNVSGTDADVYVFDVFRVQGGKTHAYYFHGAMGDLKMNVPLARATSAEAKQVLTGRPEASQQEGTSADPLVATWTLTPELQKSCQAEFYQPDRPVGLTLTLFGHASDRVYVGGATSEVYPVDLPYLHVVGRQEQEGRVSVYPAIYETHAGAPFLAGKKQLKVAPAADDADAGVALAVKVGQNRRDVMFSSRKPGVTHELEDGTRVAGEFAFISEDEQGLRLMHLVGGTELIRGGIGVRCEKPGYEATVQSVDYPNHAISLSAPWPAKLLDGQVALLGNPRHWQEFQLGQVDGTRATVTRTPRFYQSPVERIEPGRIHTLLEPLVYGCDTQHADGVTVANEDHSRSWRARLEPQERWMYLGWPGTQLSYPREVRMEDLPDANGDGRRTLRLIGRKSDGEKEGKVLLELEVTRVDPAQNLFYFRMPAEEAYQEGGWQFANRELVNEDGSKKWWASYPGTSFSWAIEGDGEKLSDVLLPDADKDGKRLLYAYHFGPGDQVRLNTFVHVRRTESNTYQVRANAACTLILPAKGPAQISTDGRDYRPHSAKATPGGMELSLSADDLAAGAVWLKVQP